MMQVLLSCSTCLRGRQIHSHLTGTLCVSEAADASINAEDELVDQGCGRHGDGMVICY